MTTLTVTRVAHASVLLAFGEHTLLTDPWFSERRGYYRGEPLGVALADLPSLAGVAVSHGHYDHYDMAAFAAYRDKTLPLVVKRGTAAAARAAGFADVTELDPWETAQLGPITVTAAPAKHSVPQNTYIFQAGGRTVYFGGDTLLIPELAEVARRFPRIDLALLPINGLRIRPLLGRKIVMGPEDAADLCGLLRPRVAVPIHYSFTGCPLNDRVLLGYAGSPTAVCTRFTAATATAAPGTMVRVLSPGEPLAIDANMKAQPMHSRVAV